MLQGRFALSLDSKGRLTVPSRQRDILQVLHEGRLTLTRHPDGCLMLLARSHWERKRQEIAGWPFAARAWQRIFLGSASDIEMDSAGRILIAPELREAAGLKVEQKVMLVGLQHYFEIWDPKVLQAQEDKAIEAGLPEALANFSFQGDQG
ncbi:MAG: division/cell wall cluster transcriptional repressor MraZ [Burkholderiales bacterium]|jgi:MraZ protein|nr:division/cell wall cluster transcriptional repressor MraZ [Burkholderiales bacterium]